MALRFLSPGRRMALVRGRTLSQLSAGLRMLSTKDDMEPEESAAITVRQVQPGSTAGELLGDTDRRLPLPGQIGLAEHLQPPPPPPPPMQMQPVRHSAAAELYHDRHMAALFSLMNHAPMEPVGEAPAETDTTAANAVALVIQAHQCPQLLKQEFRSLFRERDIVQGPLTVLVVSQRTEEDMSVWSEAVQEERSQLAQHFMSVAGDMVMRLRRLGFWADLVDPLTGRPHLGAAVAAPAPDRSSTDLSDGEEHDSLIETDDRLAMLGGGFTIEELGCCRVVRHAVWGSHVFIGCMFTDAAVDDPMLDSVISKYQEMVVPPST